MILFLFEMIQESRRPDEKMDSLDGNKKELLRVLWRSGRPLRFKSERPGFEY